MPNHIADSQYHAGAGESLRSLINAVLGSVPLKLPQLGNDGKPAIHGAAHEWRNFLGSHHEQNVSGTSVLNIGSDATYKSARGQLTRVDKVDPHLLMELTANLPFRAITRDGAPYLEQYFLFETDFMAGTINRFLTSDPEGLFHNHTFIWAASYLLYGEYIDQRLPDLARLQQQPIMRHMGSIGLLTHTDFHRVELLPDKGGSDNALQKTWTLFVRGNSWPYGWGFLILEEEKNWRNSSGLPNPAKFSFYPGNEGPKWWKTAPIAATERASKHASSR